MTGKAWAIADTTVRFESETITYTGRRPLRIQIVSHGRRESPGRLAVNLRDPGPSELPAVAPSEGRIPGGLTRGITASW